MKLRDILRDTIREYLKEEIERLRNIQSDQWSNDIFSSLLDVGINKPVGYLPLSTIVMYGGKKARLELIDWAISNGLKYGVFMRGHTASGALYIWDENSLNAMLNKYKDILIEAGVPTEAEEYVRYIEHTHVSEKKYPNAYTVVGKTFNDKRFRN